MNRWIFFFVFLTLLMIRCRSNDNKNDVVARVGNAVLYRYELQRRITWEGLKADQESEYVERWINRELLYAEAEKQSLEDQDELQWELELVEKEFIINRFLEKTFALKIQISDQEIESYYEKNKELFEVNEEEVRLLHILTNSREDANLARQEILTGKPFEEVAKERSSGFLREQGGDLGFIKKTDVINEISRNAFRLSQGRVSSVFKSSHGFHIIKVIKKRIKGSVKDLVDVRDDIIQRLRVSKERTIYYDLLFQLQNKSKVFVAVPQYRNQPNDSLTVPFD